MSIRLPRSCAVRGSRCVDGVSQGCAWMAADTPEHAVLCLAIHNDLTATRIACQPLNPRSIALRLRQPRLRNTLPTLRIRQRNAGLGYIAAQSLDLELDFVPLVS